MSKHTSGPWKITQNAKTGCKVWGADGNPVALIAGGIARSRVSDESPVPEWRRNAGLIAAAPLLLDALEQVEWAGTTDRDDGGWEYACPFCGVSASDGEHTSDCMLGVAIKAATDES